MLLTATAMTRKCRLVIGVLALLALATAAYVLPVGKAMLVLVEWTRKAGLAGMAVYAVVYVLAAVFMLPGSVLTLGAGFAYGPLVGTALVSPVSVLAATVAFVLGRTAARGWVARRIAGNPRFAAIDEAVARGGFKIVLLLRLSPVFPFSLLNYALGVSRISLGSFVLASFLGMLPGTFLYVYVGSLVTDASELLSSGHHPRSPWAQALYWGGLVATIAVTVLITRIARRALRAQVPAVTESAGTPMSAATSVGRAS